MQIAVVWKPVLLFWGILPLVPSLLFCMEIKQ